MQAYRGFESHPLRHGHTYGCGLYRLTAIGSGKPRIAAVLRIDAPAPKDEKSARGACGVPVVDGRWWIMPIGRAHRIVTFDVSDPARPKEVARLETEIDFNPHWSAKDPRSDRIVIGAELGGEQGMLLLRLDRSTGVLRYDETLRSRSGRLGYIDLALDEWPHGRTGVAWGRSLVPVLVAMRDWGRNQGAILEALRKSEAGS